MTNRPKRVVRTRRSVRPQTRRGCPLTRNRTAWCYRLCVPGKDGKGVCGRVAPHGLKSRTQRAIEERRRQLREGRAS